MEVTLITCFILRDRSSSVNTTTLGTVHFLWDRGAGGIFFLGGGRWGTRKKMAFKGAAFPTPSPPKKANKKGESGDILR